MGVSKMMMQRVKNRMKSWDHDWVLWGEGNPPPPPPERRNDDNTVKSWEFAMTR